MNVELPSNETLIDRKIVPETQTNKISRRGLLNLTSFTPLRRQSEDSISSAESEQLSVSENAEFVANTVFSRRDLSKKGIKFGLGATVLGFLGKEAVDIADGDYETGNGIYHYNVEEHRFGIDADDIPQDSDYFFREFSINSSLIKEGTVDILNENVVLQGNTFPVVSDDILRKLYKNRTELIQVDVLMPESYDEVAQIARDRLINYSGLLSLGGYNIVGSWDNIAISNNPQRRSFLKTISGAYAAWALGGNLFPVFSTGLFFKSNRETSFKNILSRMVSIAHHAHPQDEAVFVRNLIWAIKLDENSSLHEAYKKNKPKTALNMGAIHGGVLDMLSAGQNVCINILTSLPKNYLQKLVDANGGIDAFCSTTCISFVENKVNNNQPTINEIKRSAVRTHRTNKKLKWALSRKLDIPIE